MTATAELPNPLHQEFWVRPAAEIDDDLATLQAAGGVTFHPEPPQPEGIDLPVGPGSWVLTNHADIIQVSKQADVFSSAQGITFADIPVEFLEFFSSMIVMDDPRHAKLRRIVSAGFTPRMLKKLEDSVQTVASQIVDRVEHMGEVDFIVDVAAALPLKIVCDLMGVPESEFEFVFNHTNTIIAATDPEYAPEDGDVLTALLTAGGELAELMQRVAESKKGGDGTDLTTMLMNAQVPDDELSPSDLASFFILLVVAGNETTRNAIGWGLKYLTDNPEQRAIWAADFEAIAPTAVEEIVRLASPVTYMRRTALADTEINGQAIAEGEKVCMFYLAANRDPSVFEDPLTFDVQRAQNVHVGYGGPGPHFCLGAHLARREITVMFRELLHRLPDIEASGDPDLLHSSFIHGIKHLPATFTPVTQPG